MYNDKAKFFDNQVNSDWANDEYTAEELSKIDKIFNMCNINNGTNVIEPGCGTGRLTKLLAEKCGSSGKVVAFDISQGMIDKAGERLADFQNVELVCASLEELKLENESYNVVLCHQVFPHFNNPEDALKILAKTLKIGGYLMISHLVGIEEINDVHRKSNSPVENDIMPINDEIETMLKNTGFELILIEDEKEVFNILARKIQSWNFLQMLMSIK